MAGKRERIVSDMRNRVENGEWSPTDRLPSEAELAGQYGVSVETLRGALTVLEAEDLIERHQGRGTFIRQQRQRIRRNAAMYQWEKDRVSLPDDQRGNEGATEHQTELEKRDLVFEAEYADDVTSGDLSGAFEAADGTLLLRRTYSTRVHGETYSMGVITSYLLRSVIEGNPALLNAANEPWPGGTQHQLSTVKVEVDSVTDVVRSRAATAEESTALGVRPGSPVLALRKILRDTTGRVVEVADTVWPGDRIEAQYTTQLERW